MNHGASRTREGPGTAPDCGRPITPFVAHRRSALAHRPHRKYVDASAAPRPHRPTRAVPVPRPARLLALLALAACAGSRTSTSAAAAGDAGDVARWRQTAARVSIVRDSWG